MSVMDIAQVLQMDKFAFVLKITIHVFILHDQQIAPKAKVRLRRERDIKYL